MRRFLVLCAFAACARPVVAEPDPSSTRAPIATTATSALAPSPPSPAPPVTSSASSAIAPSSSPPKAEGELQRAAERGDLQGLRAILALHPDLEARDTYGKTALLAALDREEGDAALLLIDAGARIPPNAIHYAARAGHLALIERLLAKGSSPNELDSMGHGPLHRAAEQDRGAAIERLVRAGADPNLAGEDLFTPLHAACAHDKVAAARALLAAGAKLELRTRGGETALHWAIFANRPTEMHIYEKLGEPHKTRRIPKTDAPLVELLLAKGAKIDAVDNAGNTPLHQAAAMGAEPSVQLLLARGASKTAKNKDGLTPRDAALRAQRDELAKRLQ